MLRVRTSHARLSSPEEGDGTGWALEGGSWPGLGRGRASLCFWSPRAGVSGGSISSLPWPHFPEAPLSKKSAPLLCRKGNATVPQAPQPTCSRSWFISFLFRLSFMSPFHPCHGRAIAPETENGGHVTGGGSELLPGNWSQGSGSGVAVLEPQDQAVPRSDLGAGSGDTAEGRLYSRQEPGPGLSVTKGAVTWA